MYEPHPVSTCALISDCSYDPCLNGRCVMLSNGERRCNCYTNWTAEFCDVGVVPPDRRGVAESGVATAFIIIIIVCILVVLGT